MSLIAGAVGDRLEQHHRVPLPLTGVLMTYTGRNGSTHLPFKALKLFISTGVSGRRKDRPGVIATLLFKTTLTHGRVKDGIWGIIITR